MAQFNRSHPSLLDVVALTVDLPAKGLVCGQVGTVVDLLAANVFEVEFSDNNGRTYAMVPLGADQLMLLHHQPAPVETSPR